MQNSFQSKIICQSDKTKTLVNISLKFCLTSSIGSQVHLRPQMKTVYMISSVKDAGETAAQKTFTLFFFSGFIFTKWNQHKHRLELPNRHFERVQMRWRGLVDEKLFLTLLLVSHKQNIARLSLFPWHMFRPTIFLSFTCSDEKLYVKYTVLSSRSFCIPLVKWKLIKQLLPENGDILKHCSREDASLIFTILIDRTYRRNIHLLRPFTSIQ